MTIFPRATNSRSHFADIFHFLSRRKYFFLDRKKFFYREFFFCFLISVASLFEPSSPPPLTPHPSLSSLALHYVSVSYSLVFVVVVIFCLPLLALSQLRVLEEELMKFEVLVYSFSYSRQNIVFTIF